MKESWRPPTGGVEVAISSGQSDRVHVLAPGSNVSVDPPTELAYERSVRLPAKICVLVYTDSVLPMPTLTKKDQTMNGWRRPSRRVSVSVLSMMCWYVWWLRTILRKTIWSMFGAEASACRDSLDLAEYTRAFWCQVVFGGDVPLDE